MAIVAAIVGIAGCTSVRYTLVDGQTLGVPSGSKIIVGRLPGRSNQEALNEFNYLKKKIPNGCYEVYFLPELDYDLRSQGILPESLLLDDRGRFEKLNVFMPGVYILTLDLIEDKWSGGINTTSMLATLQSTEDSELYWSFRTQAKKNGMIIKGRKVNLTPYSYYSALNKSIAYIRGNSLEPCD